MNPISPGPWSEAPAPPICASPWKVSVSSASARKSPLLDEPGGRADRQLEPAGVGADLAVVVVRRDDPRVGPGCWSMIFPFALTTSFGPSTALISLWQIGVRGVTVEAIVSVALTWSVGSPLPPSTRQMSPWVIVAAWLSTRSAWLLIPNWPVVVFVNVVGVTVWLPEIAPVRALSVAGLVSRVLVMPPNVRLIVVGV